MGTRTEGLLRHLLRHPLAYHRLGGRSRCCLGCVGGDAGGGCRSASAGFRLDRHLRCHTPRAVCRRGRPPQCMGCVRLPAAPRVCTTHRRPCDAACARPGVQPRARGPGASIMRYVGRSLHCAPTWAHTTRRGPLQRWVITRTPADLQPTAGMLCCVHHTRAGVSVCASPAGAGSERAGCSLCTLRRAVRHTVTLKAGIHGV
jgi:hypothetical protein